MRRAEGGEMSRTVSVKPIATLTEQCSQCGLWFEFVHPAEDGRYLCSVCAALEAGTGPLWPFPP
jgi:hypothetical protein